MFYYDSTTINLLKWEMITLGQKQTDYIKLGPLKSFQNKSQ